MFGASTDALVAIALMGAATYATRVAGFLLLRRMRPTPFVAAWLRQLPGTVFAALSLPTVIELGPFGWMAAAMTLITQRLTGQFLAALVAGFATYAAAITLWPS